MIGKRKTLLQAQACLFICNLYEGIKTAEIISIKVLTVMLKRCSILQVANNNGENKKMKSLIHLSLRQ